MRTGFWVVCCLAWAMAPSLALAAPRKPPVHPQPAAPAAPEGPTWELERSKDGLLLFYGGPPHGQNMVMSFACLPRSGDITIRVPEASGKARLDESQSLSLTVAGIRSSFAGRVVDDGTGNGVELDVIVTARNPMFTALGGPGGLHLEGKGFAKNVSMKTVGDKLKQFLAACRK